VLVLNIYLLNIILVFIVTLLVIYLLNRLIRWWLSFQKWLKDVETKVKKQKNQGFSPSFAQGVYIPDITLEDAKDKTSVKLHSLIGSGSTLVFLDKSCLHCSINFEEFFNKKSKNDYYVIFQKQDLDYAKKISDLYNGAIKIYLTDPTIYKTLKLTFMPAFVKVNKNFIAENATPVPLKAVNFF
jgi:hypothetical protein